MANKLTLAVAGSGKTQGLAEFCGQLPADHRILAISFTKANQAELRTRISAEAGHNPRIEVIGWFQFLLRDFARPFMPFLFPSRRITGFNFEGEPNRFASGVGRYLDTTGAAYRSQLGRLSYELIEASGVALQRRLVCCYQALLIDEVQDLAAYDWDILDFLLRSGLRVTMVGDFRQAVFSTNPRSSKNKSLSHTGAIGWFREREEEGLLEIETRSYTWRCRPEIAGFSDSIHHSAGDFPPTEARNGLVSGHDGVFWVQPEDVAEYVRRFSPQCLRDSVKSGTAFDLDYINFGAAKGTSYERVLIVPTKAIQRFVTAGIALRPRSAAKFYVAVTRAAQSVAIVLDGVRGQKLPQWKPES
jgi:ATP-dependent DNA helicase UvrD/PcrA